MNMLIETYQHLLADIVVKSGVHLDIPDTITLSWVLIEGPKLDKQLLMWLEHKDHLATMAGSGLVFTEPPFPEWIKPLWDSFCLTDSSETLRYLRQLLVFCYKAELPSSYEQNEMALSQFIETDLSIDIWNEYFKSRQNEPLFREARRLVARIIYRANWQEIVPSHGPGAVYPSRKPSVRGRFLTIYDTLQSVYPFDDYFMLPNSIGECLVESQKMITEAKHIVCHLTAVPKDSRGPRLICVHPSEAIWIQQGQRRVLENQITNSRLTCGNINFHDQKINGMLALQASRDKSYVTLDLKEASDRMSCSLVRYLFGGAYKYIGCSRASHVAIDNVDEVHELRKFAPMGNCLTFPVQSLVFWALVRAGIKCRYGVNCDDVYVFGDDIIYPSEYHIGALTALVRAGFVPNMSKTFWLGSFRESCGVDAYRGINITPYRMKVGSVESYSDCVSLCDLAKRLRLGGYDNCSSYLYSRVRKYMGQLHLSNEPNTQGIYEYVATFREVVLYEQSLKYNDRLQKYQTRVALLKPSVEELKQHGWNHVQDSLVRLARARRPSEKRAEYPIPYRERLTYGWTDARFSISRLVEEFNKFKEDTTF